jgi:membrane-associated protease RseP (regulator of RpoE activity)
MKAGILTSIAATALLSISAPALAADQKPTHLFGPAPTWEQFRAIAEAGIQARLVDPESARISWTAGFYQGEYKPFLEARVQGYIACGTVNARNRMGGYAGSSGFVVVVDYDRVLYAAIERTPGGLIDAPCAKMAQAGLFPPLPRSAASAAPPALAPTSAASSSAADVVSTASGMTLRAMPDGAYISAVAPASPAATAELKPGMVIATINAIPLAGMGDAMLKVVDAAGTTATLVIVGGTTIKLAAKP